MNKLSKVGLLVVLATLGLTACGGGGGGGSGDTKIIYVDGGGDISNFNSTPSMTKSAANPYPYNTLEKLLEEWSNAHPGYKAKLNKTSSGGDRSVLLPQLQTHTAPHIAYQNATVISTDLGQDYYVPLQKYLDSPDPYLEGNKAWKTVYDESELLTTVAPDGEHYFVNLEKIPVAFVYNKTLLDAAGVTDAGNIKTFAQLISALQALDTLKGKAGYSDIGKYATEYTWYQIAIESNLFSDLVAPGDVLRKNGAIDTEELCRLFERGKYNPLEGIISKTDPTQNDYSNNRLYDYIRVISELDRYKENASFAARQRWMAGQLGFMEVTGNLLRTLSALDVSFEWGTIPFPDVTTETSQYAGVGSVRGTAGLATSYWITNRALDDGTADMCADLLMFLTAPTQNNRMIGDLKGGIPLNPTADFQFEDYLKPLINIYNEDMKDLALGKRVNWSAFNSWNALGLSYQTTFITTMQKVDSYILGGTGVTLGEATTSLAYSIKNTVKAYEIEYEYDMENWPA